MTSFFPTVFHAVRVGKSLGLRGIAHKLYYLLSAKRRSYRRDKLKDDAAFDIGGYDTGGIQHIHQLTLANQQVSGAAFNHVAVPPADFDRAFDMLDIDYRGFTFIDLGSGKGRAVLLAAKRPFKKVIGVEFALELHQLAQRNLSIGATGSNTKTIIELRFEDATKFDFPIEPTILFLFNPFGPPVITAVSDNAMTSWRSSPRQFRVIYVNPVHLDHWTAAGWTIVRAEKGVAIMSPPESVTI